MRSLVAQAAALVACSAVANGAYITVDIAPIANSDLRAYTNGSNYPTGGKSIEFGAVPFSLALVSGSLSSLGVAQLPVNDLLTVFNLSVQIPGAQRLYTLINSVRGSAGADNGSVEVFGAQGAYAVLHLTQAFNIRDHFQGGYTNSLSDPTVLPTAFSGGVRLDRQVLELPAAFLTDTVTQLRFSGIGRRPEGAALLAGATFEAIPAPGTTALVMAGFLTLARRRR